MTASTKLQSRGSMLLLAALVSLHVGCGDGSTGPESVRIRDDPSYIALLLPAVQSAREAEQKVETSTGSSYIFRIAGTLHPDGTARGSASLTDPDDRQRRIHYQLREWTGACEEGTPFLSLSGSGRALSQGRRGDTFTRTFSFAFDLELVEGARGEGSRLRWTWVHRDPAGGEGEYFETEADRVLSPAVCGS